jgi:dTDP-4-dehydrorhamnose reductase
VNRLLVTGGTGYLGGVVAEHAVTAGWDVTAVGSSDLDVRDAAAVAAFVDNLRPDAIVHTAYMRDGPTARAVNVDGSAAVAAAAGPARLVHVSTDVVFDGRLGRPYREDDVVSPITEYGRTKADAEQAVLHQAPRAIVVRTSLIYGGPGRPASPHETAALDPDGTFFTDELRSPVQVDDLAAALVELCRLDVVGILHVAGAEGVSRHRFAELIAGRPVRGATAPPGRPLDCRLDCSLARSVLRTRLRGVTDVLDLVSGS